MHQPCMKKKINQKIKLMFFRVMGEGSNSTSKKAKQQQQNTVEQSANNTTTSDPEEQGDHGMCVCVCLNVVEKNIKEKPI